MTAITEPRLSRAEVRAYARHCATQNRLERVARYAAIRGRCTMQQPAWDLGVCKRTIERYEAALRTVTP